MSLISRALGRAREVLGSLLPEPRAVASADGPAPPAGARATADWGGNYLAAAQLRNRLRGTASAVDPRRQNVWEGRTPYDDYKREQIARNGVARRCIATRAADAVRPGWATDFPTLDKGQAKEVATALESYRRDLKVKRKLRKALVWAERDGHSILIMGVDDGRSPDQPLDLDNVKTIWWLRAYPRAQYQVGDLSDGTDGVTEPGQPLWFELTDPREPEVEAFKANVGTTTSTGAPVRYHWTRVLGPFTTDDGHSRLDEYGEALEDFFSTHDAAERFANTLSVGNLEIDGWNTRTAQDEPNARGRVDEAAETLSSQNILVTDRQEETFGYKARPGGGIDGILDRKQVLLCATTGLPTMKLFGTEPAGFSSGSEVVDWYNTDVTAMFEDQVEPEVRRLETVILHAADGPGVYPVPDVFTIRMLPLRVPSAGELADIRDKTWRAVKEITGEPLLDRREARESLFGAGAAEVNPLIQLSPDDTREETPPQVEVGVAQAILAAAADPTLSPDQKRAVVLIVAPQTPPDLLARIAPDAPEPEADGPTDADALAAEPEQWKTADEIAASFGSVTAAQIKAHRCPTKGAAVEEPDPRDPGTPGLRWIKPGAKPLYRLSEVRTKFEGGGPDLDTRTPDAPATAPLATPVTPTPPPGSAPQQVE